MSKPFRPPSFLLLAVCLFGSGLTGLIYELLWTRRLQLTFGCTTFSITTVLAAFMAGLGLGSYLIGRRAPAAAGGVRLYAYLELGVGLFALLSLPLLSLVESLYALLQSWLQLGQLGATLLKFALCFPVLALPAGMMGGTLPALVRGLLRSRVALPRTVARLYGINTAGAAIGTALSGMVLIEALGLYRSMVAAALCNLAIAAVVLLRLRGAGADADGEAASPQADRPQAAPEEKLSLRAHLRSRPVAFCAVAVALTGLLSMLYEIVWTRLLSLVLGSSTYTFTIVLSLFLVGIALGALIYSRVARRRAPTPFGLTLVLLSLALWVLVSLELIPAVPYILIALGQVPGVTFLRLLGFEVLLAVTILLVPTLLLGAALPMSMGIIARALGQVGRDVGGVYLVNTVGAIAGSLLTGFALVPAIGTQSTLLVGMLANLLLVGYGVYAFGDRPLRRALGLALVALTAVAAWSRPAWPPVVFDSGLGYRLDAAAASTPRQLESLLHRSPSRLLFNEEGLNGTITVRRFRDSVTLMVNGKADASSTGDMSTQVVLGVVATMAHRSPAEVAVVGWGSGVTAHTVTHFPTVKRVDVIEIEPAVLRASRFFHRVNGAAERHPRVRVVYDDARSYLHTADRRYDVIISEPSNPWLAGVSNLFSVDFYALARRRLRPGGVFGQWLQLYSIDARSVALVLRTLQRSFPHVELWLSDPGNVVLVASDRPIRIPVERVRRTYRRSPALRRQMAVWGPGRRREDFFGGYLLGGAGIRDVVQSFAERSGSGPEVMTDDHPILEYRAVRGLYDEQHDHAAALVRAGMTLGGRARAMGGVAAAGTARLIRSKTRLRLMVTERAMRRFKNEPEVRLARGLALLKAGRLKQALEQARSLPPGDRRFAAEAALLEARILLRRGDAAGALRRLDAVDPGERAAVHRWYKLRAALGTGDLEGAYHHADALLTRLDDPRDLAAPRLPRKTVYKTLAKLIDRSGSPARCVALLGRRRDPRGRYDRSWLLARAYLRLGRTREAVREMNRLLAWHPVSDASLTLCERIYTRAGDPRSAWCRERRRRLGRTPKHRPLWTD